MATAYRFQKAIAANSGTASTSMLVNAACGAAEAVGAVEKPGAAAGAVALAAVVGGVVSATPVGAVRLAVRHAVERVDRNVAAPAPVDNVLTDEARVVEDAAEAVATENPTVTPAACKRRRVDAS